MKNRHNSPYYTVEEAKKATQIFEKQLTQAPEFSKIIRTYVRLEREYNEALSTKRECWDAYHHNIRNANIGDKEILSLAYEADRSDGIFEEISRQFHLIEDKMREMDNKE